MKLKEAMDQLIASPEFSQAANKDSKLRVYRGRYKRGTLGNAACLDLLKQFNYNIQVIDPETVSLL